MPVSFLRETPQAADDLSEDDLRLLDELMDALIADIEACWNSSIACCDDCYDDYAARWPLAHTNENGIQYQSCPADIFFAGSKHLQRALTEADFNRLLSYVECPNCKRSMGSNLFAFELPFDAATFMEDLERLGALALNTPFLVATDAFAQEIRNEIVRLCAATKAELPVGQFFRARSIEISNAFAKDFGAPPPSVTGEGRYNHAGRPVLYIADEHLTCWEECRRPATEYSIATLEFIKPIRLLDLSEVEKIPGVMAPVMYSNLAAAPSDGLGWDRPEYVLTRFVADCAKFEGIDGIRYLSTRSGTGSNIVLLDGRSAMNYVRVTEVQKLKKPPNSN